MTHGWVLAGGDFATDFATSGRVKSCKVLPEVWLSTLGQMSDPSLVEESEVFEIKDDDDNNELS